MVKCIFCDIEGEFHKGATIGSKGRGICGNCMEWLSYYIKRQDLIEREEDIARSRGIEVKKTL